MIKQREIKIKAWAIVREGELKIAYRGRLCRSWQFFPKRKEAKESAVGFYKEKVVPCEIILKQKR